MSYTVPNTEAFHTRFPEFEDADDDQIEAAIVDASRLVGTNWIEADYATGILLLAAHFMQVAGGAYDSGGLRSFSVGAISVTYGDSAVIAELGATSYGQRFNRLRNLNVRGPLVV